MLPGALLAYARRWALVSLGNCDGDEMGATGLMDTLLIVVCFPRMQDVELRTNIDMGCQVLVDEDRKCLNGSTVELLCGLGFGGRCWYFHVVKLRFAHPPLVRKQAARFGSRSFPSWYCISSGLTLAVKSLAIEGLSF